MIYFKELDLAFLDIFKNGSNVFKELMEVTIGQKADLPFFEKFPTHIFTIVRNPYNRLISQFYHVNRKKLDFEWKYAMHAPIFRKWVKETYHKDNMYDGVDGHYFSQSRLIQYGEGNLPEECKIFKIENLIPYEIFYFLELSEEQKLKVIEDYNQIQIKNGLNGHHSTDKQGNILYFYNSESIDICNEYFKMDFENFNYEMLDSSNFNCIRKFI